MSADIIKKQTEQERARACVANAMNQLSQMSDAAAELGMEGFRNKAFGIWMELTEAERLLRKKEGKS